MKTFFGKKIVKKIRSQYSWWIFNHSVWERQNLIEEKQVKEIKRLLNDSIISNNP